MFELNPIFEISSYPTETELAQSLELDNVPFVIKKAVLMSQGIWNGIYYSKSEIEKAFNNTDWNSRENKNLFLDHEDEKAGDWIGEVENMYFMNDTLYGDAGGYISSTGQGGNDTIIGGLGIDILHGDAWI